MLTLSDATRLAEILHAVRSYAHADSMILSRVVAATGIAAKTIKRLADEHPDQIAVDTTYTATRQIYRVRLTAEKPTRTPKHPLKDPPAGFTGDDGQFTVCPICQRRRQSPQSQQNLSGRPGDLPLACGEESRERRVES